MYTREEQLEIFARIGVTKKVYDILRQIKKKEGISLAKIVSNLIIQTYGNKNESNNTR